MAWCYFKDLRVKKNALLQWDDDPELLDVVERAVGRRPLAAAYVLKIVDVCTVTNTAAIEVRWRCLPRTGLSRGRLIRLPINPDWTVER